MNSLQSPQRQSFLFILEFLNLIGIFGISSLSAQFPEYTMILLLPLRNFSRPCAAPVHKKSEERRYSYFTCMIGNMNVIEGRNFLRFVTGSSVCSTTAISVTFNSLSGLGRRPIEHTCDCMLQLSSTYLNYDVFYYEFSSIFEKVNEEYTFQRDAV